MSGGASETPGNGDDSEIPEVTDEMMEPTATSGAKRADTTKRISPARGNASPYGRFSGQYPPLNLDDFPRGQPSSLPLDSKLHSSVWENSLRLAEHPEWIYRPGQMVFTGLIDGPDPRTGEVKNGMVGINDDRHLLTVAGSRAGKSVSVIIPNLIDYDGSVLVIDPKGELARKTAMRRGAGGSFDTQLDDGTPAVRDIPGLGQEVYVLDPFEVSGHQSSGFNPLDLIDVTKENSVDDATLIADGLIVRPKNGDGNSEHFFAAAQQFIRGLILYVAAVEPPKKRNLLRMRELLMGNEDALGKLLVDMEALGDKAWGIPAQAASLLSATGGDELGSILSTARNQTMFLDSPALRRTLERSDFSPGDMKRKRMSVYLCLPAARMPTHARWLRVIINLALVALEEDKTELGKDEPKVLFIMDEFRVLDHLESIEKAAGQIAGFGVRLWPILQDLSQLQAMYPDSWETFLGNAGHTQWFGITDMTTLRYLSERLGETTLLVESKAEVGRQQKAEGLLGRSEAPQTVPLMIPEEISRHFSRQSGNQLIIWPGAWPIAMKRIKYYTHGWFAGMTAE